MKQFTPQEFQELLRSGEQTSEETGLAPHASQGGYLTTLTASVLRYADAHQDFAMKLHALLNRVLPAHMPEQHPMRQPLFSFSPAKEGAAPPYHARRDAEVLLLPDSHPEALRRILWILGAAETHAAQEEHPAQEALYMLRDWADEQELGAPKHLVVGIIRVAIPGISLGRISRRRQNAPVVLNRDALNAFSRERLAQDVSASVLQMTLQEIEAAGGQVHNVEPTVAEWLQGDRSVSLYHAEAGALGALAQELTLLEIPHAKSWDEGTLALIAASPTLRHMHHLSRWGVEPLE